MNKFAINPNCLPPPPPPPTANIKSLPSLKFIDEDWEGRREWKYKSWHERKANFTKICTDEIFFVLILPRNISAHRRYLEFFSWYTHDVNCYRNDWANSALVKQLCTFPRIIFARKHWVSSGLFLSKNLASILVFFFF